MMAVHSPDTQFRRCLLHSLRRMISQWLGFCSKLLLYNIGAYAKLRVPHIFVQSHTTDWVARMRGSCRRGGDASQVTHLHGTVVCQSCYCRPRISADIVPPSLESRATVPFYSP